MNRKEMKEQRRKQDEKLKGKIVWDSMKYIRVSGRYVRVPATYEKLKHGELGSRKPKVHKYEDYQ